MLYLKSEEYVGKHSDIRVVERTPQLDYPEHRHDFSELILVSSGHGMHVVNGQQTLMLPNTLACVGSQDYHLYAENRDVMLVNVLYNKGNLPIHGHSADIIKKLESNTQHLLLPEAAFQKLYLIAEEIKREQSSTDQYSRQMQVALFEQLLMCIGRLSTLNNENSPITNAVVYISNNFRQQDISVNRVCDLFKVTPKALNRYVFKTTGLTTNKLIHVLRIREATLMLRQGARITDVGLLIGYNDSNYFSTKFKSMMGTTPREYLKSFLPN